MNYAFYWRFLLKKFIIIQEQKINQRKRKAFDGQNIIDELNWTEMKDVTFWFFILGKYWTFKIKISTYNNLIIKYMHQKRFIVPFLSSSKDLFSSS